MQTARSWAASGIRTQAVSIDGFGRRPHALCVLKVYTPGSAALRDCSLLAESGDRMGCQGSSPGRLRAKQPLPPCPLCYRSGSGFNIFLNNVHQVVCDQHHEFQSTFVPSIFVHVCARPRLRLIGDGAIVDRVSMHGSVRCLPYSCLSTTWSLS